MAGIIGFIGKDHLVDLDAPCIDSLSGILASQWQSENCQLSLKVPALNVAHQSVMTAQLNIDIWGDLYSIGGETKYEFNWLEYIEKQYLDGTLRDFAAKLNGYFLISIFDKRSEVLTIFNDRYGIKPLYLWQKKQHVLGFSSELKGLLLHSQHLQKIDLIALDTFIDVGHHVGLNTLYTDVKRMSPASILSINTKQQTLTQQHYWHWSDIQANDDITFEQAVDGLFHNLDQAMSRAMNAVKQPDLAITLSGGLDSRVLLAGAKQHFKGVIRTYTFGEKGCDDGIIAEKVAKVAGVENNFISIDGDNWFNGREHGIWLTDGAKNVLHMHALSAVKHIEKHSNYVLNGYLGDLIAGGSYLFEPSPTALSSLECAQLHYGKHAKRAMFDPEYFAHASTDPLYIYNRGVRFTSMGSDLLSHRLNSLKPFLDNDLVEYIYCLPDAFRENGKLYQHMLLKYYPDYFNDIPRQSTGKVISVGGKPAASALNPMKLIKNWINGSFLEGVARKAHHFVTPKRNYVDYKEWLKSDGFREYIEKNLLKDSSQICQLLSREKVTALVGDFYGDKQGAKFETIGVLLTLEIYINQLNGNS